MMLKSNLKVTLMCCLGLMVLVEKAQAIPAFARKYQTSCATCHEAYPRLNGVGESFRLNGYRFTDDELYIKDEPVELGDEAYKRLWPQAIWPSDMPGLPPISVTLDNEAIYDIGGTKAARTDFNFPKRSKIMAAGALGDAMSAFVELGFTRQGAGASHHGGAATTEGTETEVEGWLQFEDLFGLENAFNFRIGSLGMHEMGLFTARSHNSFSPTGYLYSSWSMPSPGAHNIEDVVAGVTEHDGVSMTGNPYVVHAQPGVELNGFNRSWRYAVGIVNGNAQNFNDNNNEKDVFFQIAHKIGGLGFDGSGTGEQGTLGGASNPWQDDSLTLSFFGYSGTSPVTVTAENDAADEDDDYSSTQADRFWRAGPGALWRTGDLQLGCGYVWGRNKNPFGVVSTGSVASRSWFVEANYFAQPWIMPYARYEVLTLDLPSAVTSTDEASWAQGANQKRIVTGTKMLLRANVSLGIEGILYLKDSRESSYKNNSMVKVTAGIAF
ncbi:MAG: hypothetical protein HQ515_14145 [Phycisphaeraceae bacterium]|nr:hypothetical protein [Phycisphaeraceae bacterium]